MHIYGKAFPVAAFPIASPVSKWLLYFPEESCLKRRRDKVGRAASGGQCATSPYDDPHGVYGGPFGPGVQDIVRLSDASKRGSLLIHQGVDSNMMFGTGWQFSRFCFLPNSPWQDGKLSEFREPPNPGYEKTVLISSISDSYRVWRCHDSLLDNAGDQF